ncbi:MAG: response regulator, partial [Acidimicrobiia bacterium]|nr:response regulator [Acidimicrobiia bacterium]
MATVLVVDDDRDIRELVAMKLKLDGIDVLEAPNGLAALEVLGANEVDLVILDLMMPVMDGVETCRALRAN